MDCLIRACVVGVLIALTLVRPADAVSYPELLSSFDVLQTVAGTALVTGAAVNGWFDDMEGGLAIQAELSRPHMTMADWHGNLYIADKDAHAIRQVRPDGTIHTLAGTNFPGFNGDGNGIDVDLFEPNGLYTFPNGVTYILDLGNSMVRKLSLDGRVTTIFSDPYGMTVGRGLWVSPDETEIFYASGTDVRRWTEEDGVSIYASGFLALGNLAIDPEDGNVVVTDREGHAVFKVFSDGTRQQIAGNGGTSGGGSGRPALQTGLKEVRGIQFHPEGGYFLATHDGGQVWFVDDDERIHLLIDGDDDGTHAGDGFPLSTPGRKISEPRAVTLSPAGDLIVTEHDGGYIRFAAALNPWKMGDYDQDRDLDESDIDQLTLAVRARNHPQTLDLTFDGLVDERDRDAWVTQLRQTWFGDANLDGEFNSRDFVHVFQRGEYEDDLDGNSGWGDGDWNGDGDFSSQDFVIAFQAGGYEMGPRTAVVANVPEPVTAGLLALGFAMAAVRGRRRFRAGRGKHLG
jgi:hypothetical protein